MKTIIKIFILSVLMAFVINAYALQIQDQVYAIVGNKIILQSAIQKRAALENIPFDTALHQLIEENLLLYEADQEQIKVPSNEVLQRLNQIKKGFPSTSDFLKFLNKNGFSSVKSFKEYLKEQIKVENLIQQNVVKNIQISPVEIAKKMENMNIGKILNLRTMTFNNKKDAEDFIKKFNTSDEISKMQNIGWVNIDELNTVTAKIVENTPKGTLSQPFENSGQWTVFYVAGIKENNLKDIYTQAREEILKEKYPKELNKYILKLKKQIPITILNSE